MGCAMPPHFMPSKRSHAPSRCSNTSVIKCEPLYMSVAMSLYLPTTVCLTISSCCSFGCNLYCLAALANAHANHRPVPTRLRSAHVDGTCRFVHFPWLAVNHHPLKGDGAATHCTTCAEKTTSFCERRRIHASLVGRYGKLGSGVFLRFRGQFMNRCEHTALGAGWTVGARLMPA